MRRAVRSISMTTPQVGSGQTTRASVLRDLVKLAEQTWTVYDPPALLEAVQQREGIASTAQPSGVAIPHPRRATPPVMSR